jgi:endogenous inhibitor of DNA gyrase (YacG/DUF329 family)
MMVRTARKCPECGSAVPVLSGSGRPRRFCSPRCTSAWANESKRLARDLEAARAELAEAESLAELWSKVDYVTLPSRRWAAAVPGLQAEVMKLEEELEVRRHI